MVNVLKLEVKMSALRCSHYLPSEHINHAKGALFTLRRILQHGQSAIVRGQNGDI